MTLGLMDLARTAVASSPELAQSARLHLADACIAHSLGVQTAQAVQMRAAWQLMPPFPALSALPWHAACLRLSEVDDIHRPSAVTAAAMVVPTALAVAEWQHSTPQALASALTAGYRVALQLGVAMGGARLLTQGLWPSYLVAPCAAAATAGHLLGLDEGAMAHALSLALSQTGRSVGRSQGEWPGRWWLFGQAVHGGCQAAMAAQQGMQGDLGLLNPAWLQAVGGAGSVALAHAPADPWREMSFKPHCAAKQTLAALHASSEPAAGQAAGSVFATPAVIPTLRRIRPITMASPCSPPGESKNTGIVEARSLNDRTRAEKRTAAPGLKDPSTAIHSLQPGPQAFCSPCAWYSVKECWV